jgi:hypothetical protein
VSVALWPETDPDQGLWPTLPNAKRAAPAPSGWRHWLSTLFPVSVRAGFAPRHVTFWDWLWAIELDSTPDPFVGIWPRGGAKSSSAELGTTALGVRGKRMYALYVRDTQERADDSVSNIGRLLESSATELYYPEHASRRVTKYGTSKGWRRNRLWTAGGFVVDALGMDVAGRGAKLDDQRPDLIIFDDIDGRHDSPHVTEKKLTTIKESLIPAGTPNVAVIAIQNLITKHGIFAKLADGTADMLTTRVMSGPEPALLGMKTEPRVDKATGITRPVITAGRPTWAGQGVPECQVLMNLIGLSSFRREAQHEVKDREGALWKSEMIEATRVSKRADRYKRIVVGIDPSGGAAEIGIIAGGLRYDGHVDILVDRTQKGALGPRNWAKVALDLYETLGADVLLAEKNFGGDMVSANIHAVNPRVSVKMVTASRGKDVRAEPVATRYEEGRVHHVGHFPELEAEMTGWVPGDPESPNRLDAKVWVVTELLPTRLQTTSHAASSTSQFVLP